MTQTEVIEQYGEIELKFSSYYKYSFTYSYKNEDLEIRGQFGGSGDDIYRYDCSPDKVVKVKDYPSELMYLSIRKNGEEIFNYNDY